MMRQLAEKGWPLATRKESVGQSNMHKKCVKWQILGVFKSYLWVLWHVNQATNVNQDKIDNKIYYTQRMSCSKNHQPTQNTNKYVLFLKNINISLYKIISIMQIMNAFSIIVSVNYFIETFLFIINITYISYFIDTSLFNFVLECNMSNLTLANKW